MTLPCIIFSFIFAVQNLLRGLNTMSMYNLVFAVIWFVIGIFLIVKYIKEKDQSKSED